MQDGPLRDAMTKVSSMSVVVAGQSRRIAELEAALRASADRWHDLGDIIKENGSYTNHGFCHASARRYYEVLSRKPSVVE